MGTWLSCSGPHFANERKSWMYLSPQHDPRRFLPTGPHLQPTRPLLPDPPPSRAYTSTFFKSFLSTYCMPATVLGAAESTTLETGGSNLGRHPQENQASTPSPPPPPGCISFSVHLTNGLHPLVSTSPGSICTPTLQRQAAPSVHSSLPRQMLHQDDLPQVLLSTLDPPRNEAMPLSPTPLREPRQQACPFSPPPNQAFSSPS